jgi:hypothetical protein
MDEHLRKYFSSGEILVYDEKHSPDFHMDVYVIVPGERRDFFTLLTSGVSSIPMNVPDPRCNPYMELITFLPASWPIGKEELGSDSFYWPVKLIKDLGRFPNTHNTWLGFGHTIPEPKDSFLYEKGFEATVLLKSKTIDEDFQRVSFDDGIIDILMPFPITGKELAFKKEKGIMELMKLYMEYEGDDLITSMREDWIR